MKSVNNRVKDMKFTAAAVSLSFVTMLFILFCMVRTPVATRGALGRPVRCIPGPGRRI